MAEHNLLSFSKLAWYQMNFNISIKSEEKQRKRKNGEKNSFIRMCRSHNLSGIQFYLQFEDHRISFKCFTTESYEDYFHIKVTNAQLRRYFFEWKICNQKFQSYQDGKKKKTVAGWCMWYCRVSTKDNTMNGKSLL